jgi:ATP-dependent Clp protease ATP-binding subunit ClpC
MFERFTDRARRVVVLAQEEARAFNHNYIGTEHILLGLLREGEGVAAQVLVKLGADLGRVRQQVIQLLHGYQGKVPATVASQPRERIRHPGAQDRLEAIETRLAAIELRVGTGPGVDDLAEQCQQLSTEIERLRVLLRQHGIGPDDEPA